MITRFPFCVKYCLYVLLTSCFTGLFDVKFMGLEFLLQAERKNKIKTML